MHQVLHKAMALADAELRASEVPSLIQELARSPALVRALQVYMAVGRSRIARPYAAKRDAPVPQWLIDTVMTAPMAEPARQRPAPLRAVAGSLLGWLKDKYRMPGWSLAAGPAVAAALAAVSTGLLVPTASHGESLLAAQMQRAIETTGSGEEARLLTLRPVATLLSQDQTSGRQIEMRAAGERTAAVACRGSNGDWQILKQTAPYPVGTLPAGSSREELDRFVGTLVSGPLLEREEVKKLSTSGWQGGAAAPSVTPKQ